MEYKWEQYIFTPKDFEGAGQYIVREHNNKKHSPHFTDTGYLSTVMMKIGYRAAVREKELSNRYILIDMSDGLTTEGYYTNTGEFTNGRHLNPSEQWIWNPFAGKTSYEAKQKLCDYLNNNPYSKTFRFATNEELIRVAAHQRWKTK
jgi:hypothetical protein